MAINAVAPWEGELVWKGEVSRGKTTTGVEWKRMDFTLKYEDHQMNEKFMTFSLFGAGKVSTLEGYALGTWLKVLWWPEASQGRDGKYYPRNSAISIFLAEAPAKSADTKIVTTDYPQQKPAEEAWKNPLQQPGDSDDLSDGSDLPF